MQIYKIRVNHNLCTGCNVCVVSCPVNFDKLRKEGKLNDENAVILVKNGIARTIYDEDRKINCDGCGICEEACPQDAIEIEIIEVE